jgi:hypothetical protein
MADEVQQDKLDLTQHSNNERFVREDSKNAGQALASERMRCLWQVRALAAWGGWKQEHEEVY